MNQHVPILIEALSGYMYMNYMNIQHHYKYIYIFVCLNIVFNRIYTQKENKTFVKKVVIASYLGNGNGGDLPSGFLQVL